LFINLIDKYLLPINHRKRVFKRSNNITISLLFVLLTQPDFCLLNLSLKMMVSNGERIKYPLGLTVDFFIVDQKLIAGEIVVVERFHLFLAIN